MLCQSPNHNDHCHCLPRDVRRYSMRWLWLCPSHLFSRALRSSSVATVTIPCIRSCYSLVPTKVVLNVYTPEQVAHLRIITNIRVASGDFLIWHNPVLLSPTGTTSWFDSSRLTCYIAFVLYRISSARVSADNSSTLYHNYSPTWLHIMVRGQSSRPTSSEGMAFGTFFSAAWSCLLCRDRILGACNVFFTCIE
jgi:hypothetical protein